MSNSPQRAVILFGDLDRDEIIVDTTNTSGGGWPVGVVPELVEYDDNDRFDVQGPGDSEPKAVRNIEVFEMALAQYLAKSPTDGTGTGACLEWENSRREAGHSPIQGSGTPARKDPPEPLTPGGKVAGDQGRAVIGDPVLDLSHVEYP